MRIALPTFLIAAAVLVACTNQQPQSAQQYPGRAIAEGSVLHVGTEFGNAYTSISPDRYEALGLEPGMRIHVTFPARSVVLTVGENYDDVPSGKPLAVLHREGLTFAIRDGDFNETYSVKVGTPFKISAVPAGR